MNKETIYKTEIEPLVKQLKEKCINFGIPMFFTAAVADNGEETTYTNQVVDGDYIGVPLTDDRMKKHINVYNGFETVLPPKDPTFDELDF